MIEKAIDFLLNTQNSDGGWGVVPGKQSHTEATAFALLGLRCAKEQSLAKSMNQGLRWLTEQQNADGSWPLTAQVRDRSWSTALAVLSLTFFETHRQLAFRGANWLLHQKGQTLGWRESLRYRWAPQTMAVPLNPDLQGWSWVPNSFSWVEPTAYTLIALKKLKPFLKETQAEERIHQGELLIYDRMCTGGGWNYGNVRVLGEELWAYPDITAVTLIALQDHREKGANQLSLQALRKMLAQVQSGLTLSWSLLCFSLYGQDGAEWKTLLTKSYESTGFLDETKVMALALLAHENEATTFRV